MQAQRKQMEERGDTVDVRAVTIKKSDKWTAENVWKAQQEHGDIGPVLKRKESNRPRPEWKEMFPESPTLKAM